MLAKKVIATGVTHLTDARYFAAWEVDYLCFSLGTGDENSVTPEYLVAMREWVQGPKIVAEFGANAGTVLTPSKLRELSVSHVLLPVTTEAEPYRAAGIEVIANVPVAGYHSVEDLEPLLSDRISILDFTAGGIEWADLLSGTPFSTEALAELIGEREVFLRIDIGGRNPRDFPYGFAVRGSSEEKVGYKSFDDLDDLFEGLEVFD